eukprot:TRINITY_DN35952_c0_g1_i1.p1 TRINITY_DN35952_c0_g1~~TRINITY_DN35952_c0_g1_i1.p1  ORF type:complete len:106 (+),score=15.33 TRINITY_DN35952_c0_g1_i1:1-318(+)
MAVMDCMICGNQIEKFGIRQVQYRRITYHAFDRYQAPPLCFELSDSFDSIPRWIACMDNKESDIFILLDQQPYIYLVFKKDCRIIEIGRAVQQECRDRSRMPSSA